MWGGECNYLTFATIKIIELTSNFNKLILSGNQIASINNAYICRIKLFEDFEFNTKSNLYTINPDAFINLTELTHLDLSFGQLKILDLNTSTNIRRLYELDSFTRIIKIVPN